jgi:hypothetical protein
MGRSTTCCVVLSEVHIPNVQCPRPELVVQGNRAEYRYGNITEWYVNDERGVEQGFTITESGLRNAEPGNGDLLLDLTLTGNCIARQNGDAINLIAPSGETVLQYGHLMAVDANGKALACRMALLEREPLASRNPGERLGSASPSKSLEQSAIVRLSVSTAGAAFPITIDPLFCLIGGRPVLRSRLGTHSYGCRMPTTGRVPLSETIPPTRI